MAGISPATEAGRTSDRTLTSGQGRSLAHRHGRRPWGRSARRWKVAVAVIRHALARGQSTHTDPAGRLSIWAQPGERPVLEVTAPRRCVPPPRRTSRPMPEAWVYLLRCRDGSLYTGWTVDLERRLARHRSGVASHYTASRLPVELALAIPVSDRTAARRMEARIKRLSRPAKLALLTSVETP
jgi:putative endonuclease